MSIINAAEFMLSIQTFQSVQDLARHFGVSKLKAAQWMTSICNDSRYTVIVMDHGDNVKIKVEAIEGRGRSIESIATEAILFKRPKMLVV